MEWNSFGNQLMVVENSFGVNKSVRWRIEIFKFSKNKLYIPMAKILDSYLGVGQRHDEEATPKVERLLVDLCVASCGDS